MSFRVLVQRLQQLEHELECRLPTKLKNKSKNLRQYRPYSHSKKRRTKIIIVGNESEGDFKSKGMKRIGNLYPLICSLENLQLADIKASKGKRHQSGVIRHSRNREQNILRLQDMLINKTYKTSKYHTFTVNEGKERLVYQLPYFPDRITHHAIMNVLEPVFVSMFTALSY